MFSQTFLSRAVKTLFFGIPCSRASHIRQTATVAILISRSVHAASERYVIRASWVRLLKSANLKPAFNRQKSGPGLPWHKLSPVSGRKHLSVDDRQGHHHSGPATAPHELA